jgi:hypothetical protein
MRTIACLLMALGLPAALAAQSGIEDAGTHNDQAFEVGMATAAQARQAGRHAEAAEQFRRLALQHPNHAQASVAHRLAVLCTADWMRESPPADHTALAESYKRLLREHLTHWPSHAPAEEVRLWLGQLLAARRDWPAAIEVLQQIEPQSPGFSEAVTLITRGYEEQLRQLRGDTDENAARRAQLLVAASSYLQPIITGPENHWPDRWSELQRNIAVALARLHLRFSPQPSPYAVQLLAAALRGKPQSPDSAEYRASKAAARVLLVEALARNGKPAEALAIVKQIRDAPTGLLLESLAAIHNLLLGHWNSDGGEHELGELILALLPRVEARRSDLDAAAISRLSLWRGAALDAAGERDAAMAQYAALAAQAPEDGEIQERYAAFLAASDSEPELRQALARWQQVESRSRRGGPRWRRARQARIELLTRLGERTEAEKLLRLTRLLYPDWDDVPLTE